MNIGLVVLHYKWKDKHFKLPDVFLQPYSEYTYKRMWAIQNTSVRIPGQYDYIL